MLRIATAGTLVLIVGSIPAARTPGAMACTDLKALALPNTTITMAEFFPEGGFPAPGGRVGGANVAPPPMPAFCRVAATIAPSSDSEIRIEVWMPAEDWNGKFQGVGNGGWSGAIGLPVLAAGLRRGYATASTDTGHTGGSGQFALGHPEQLIDFAWRAVHEMTVQGKAIVNAFYGNRIQRAYWTGCSSGGKQGLKEAQRFPDDYDGIVAGAPANNWTHLMVSSLWIAHATLLDPADYLSREKFAVLHRGVLAACDARDNVSDGVLEDPTQCRFDPKVLQCAGADGADCLTARQVAAARKIYAAAINPRSKEEIYPGLEPGSELQWIVLAGGPSPLSIAYDHFKYVVFKNPAWDFKSFDFDKDVALVDSTDNGLINATDPDLTKFVGRGGKLLLYHGWNDQLIAPRNTINYYRAATAKLGAAAASSVRLFMAPGVAHCAGGDGPGNFDMLTALEGWVERGDVPARIVASRVVNGTVERTRPLCAYPQTAQYGGTGSTDDAANFVCRTP